MKTVEVVAAIIIENDKILCTQRNLSKLDYISYKWEFPGGKVEAGETEEEAIKREIIEELDLEIFDLKKYITVDHTYPDFRIIMHSYKAHCKNKEPNLKEHVAHKWLSKEELGILDWAQADVPIVDALKGE